uniref:CRISPR-associated endoribonuclease Cas6 n=1 Tax=Thermosporothrix sp. COM3 TaxID=2490863 RepID=A0A455SJ34_9CHLR|nr:CRISPR-associated endoribonuclease Cas6 [Thermosporothrix sp. COM3]
MSATQDSLFALLLTLHPVEASTVPISSGHLVQSAFLDLIRQADPALSEWLHRPNQRRPYTISALQFPHLTPRQYVAAMYENRPMQVLPAHSYSFRITLLDTIIFQTLLDALLTKAHTLRIRIGEAHFAIHQIQSGTEPEQVRQSWAGSTTFQHIHTLAPARKRYRFEFASPTAFSKGQRPWGKMLALLPEPGSVFESLARQWETFAPAGLRLSDAELLPRQLESWCAENVIVHHYELQSCYVPSGSYGHNGFIGNITYEVKGNPTAPEARWLTPLARFAYYSGVGAKTSMGMGQTRCIPAALSTEKERKNGSSVTS